MHLFSTGKGDLWNRQKKQTTDKEQCPHIKKIGRTTYNAWQFISTNEQGKP